MKYTSSAVWGVYSVWYRHAKVYQKTWLVNCLPPLLGPLLYLLAFGYGLTPLVKAVPYAGHTVPYLQFIAPGMIAVGVLFQSFFEGSYGSTLRLKYQKTWQLLLTAPLSFIEIFLGELLWATTKGVLAGILTGIVVVILGIYSGWHLLLSLPLIILGSLMFGSMGILTTAIVRTAEEINIPLCLLIIPMFTICGTYFPRDTLPPILGRIADILPLAPLIDLLRWSLGVPSWWILDLIVLLLWTGGFAVLAARLIYPQLIRT